VPFKPSSRVPGSVPELPRRSAAAPRYPRAAQRREEHWDAIYGSRSDAELSWYQSTPELSLQLIQRHAAPRARVLDAGGGVSRLGAILAEAGWPFPTVVDVSQKALDRAREREGGLASKIRWIRAELTRPCPLGRVDLWHDRAVFHFLTCEEERQGYRRNLFRALVPGGIAIVSAFDPGGPTTCSGLPVARYTGPELARALGPGLELLRSEHESHRTPWGTDQSFTYSVLRRAPRPKDPPTRARRPTRGGRLRAPPR
jgi:SAM-dependent methyltransferase